MTSRHRDTDRSTLSDHDLSSVTGGLVTIVVVFFRPSDKVNPSAIYILKVVDSRPVIVLETKGDMNEIMEWWYDLAMKG